jgi:small GTP-binding protein
MIKKKVCMLGSFAVGKTSLVQRFVKSIFSDKYHTTIGVKIDKKAIELNDAEINLLLWDIHGEDDHQKVQASYLLGAAGYFLVIDGTRRDTIKMAESLHGLASKTLKNKPFILLINKADMADEWEITKADIYDLEQKGWIVMKTSAKTGLNVEEAFIKLTEMMLENAQ